MAAQPTIPCQTSAIHWSLCVALLTAACGAEADGAGDQGAAEGGGKADDIDPADFACTNVSGITLEALAAIDDPIAAFLIKRGEGCAPDYRALVEQLRTVDPDGCVAGRDLTTRIVSDDARIDPQPDNYRTVTTRACGSREPHALMWTLLSVNPTEDMGRRTFVEMQALDRTTGLYDYWVFSGGRYRFEGNSLQAAAGSISCGGCHRDGGVLMKELDDPWIHWESEGSPLPGVDALFTAHGPLLGERGNGRELEALVRIGNDATIDARIAHQSDPATGDVAKLLRPLFCSEQVNLDTAGTLVDGPVESIPADLLLDPRWGVAAGVTIDPAVYEAAVVAAGQMVPGVAGRVDTEFKLVFPERSGFDDAYVQALVDQGVIDADFMLDVLAVDFTRPLFSDARCGLLAFSPSFGAGGIAEPEPAAIRAAFIAAIEAAAPAAGTPAAELLLNLLDPQDGAVHRGRAEAFVAACGARDDRPFVDDVLRTNQLAKELVRSTTSLIEHSEQLSETQLDVEPSARLDPSTCALLQ